MWKVSQFEWIREVEFGHTCDAEDRQEVDWWDKRIATRTGGRGATQGQTERMVERADKKILGQTQWI